MRAWPICGALQVQMGCSSRHDDEICRWSRDAVAFEAVRASVPAAVSAVRGRAAHLSDPLHASAARTQAAHDAGLPLRLRRRREAAAAQGHHRRSRRSWRTAARTNKHTTTVSSDELSEFGHELERDGRQPEAVACYALAIRNHPSKAIGWFDLATAWQYNDRANALKYYAHGLRLQPADGFRYSQLGVLLRAAERGEEAVRRFEQAVRLLPDDADAYFHLGGSHEQLGRPADALRVYRSALDVEHKNEARIQNNIGNALGRLGRWGDALAAYREAEEADPELAETQFNLAHVHTSLGRLDEAERHVRAAQRLEPGRPPRDAQGGGVGAQGGCETEERAAREPHRRAGGARRPHDEGGAGGADAPGDGLLRRRQGVHEVAPRPGALGRRADGALLTVVGRGTSA